MAFLLRNLAVKGNAVVSGDLTVLGTTTSIDTINVNVADNHLYLNKDYTATTAQTGGLVINYLPTATTDLVDNGAFTAGVAATSDPSIVTAGSATFTTGDLVQVSGANTALNNGIFEVADHVGTLLTVRGVGVTARVEDFTQNQFTTDATVAGAITKVNLSVMRAGTDGRWEVGIGATTPLAFAKVDDHGALSGLADDDHVQYALLAGRTSGQALIGGVDPSAVLSFESTSDATKGTIDFKDATRVDDIDTLTATTMLLGKATATKVEIADTGVTTEVQGLLTAMESAEVTGSVAVDTIDTLNPGIMSIGAATATRVEVADTGVTTEMKGPATALEGMSVTGTHSADVMDALTATTMTLGAVVATKVEIAETGVTTEMKGPATALEGMSVTGTLSADEVDALTATTMTLGAAVATKVEIADTGITTEMKGPATALEGMSVTGTHSADVMDALTAGIMTLGAVVATKVEIAETGVTTEMKGPATALEGMSVTGTHSADDMDALTATTLTLGAAVATLVEIANTGVITEVQGPLVAAELATFSSKIVEAIKAYTGAGPHVLATDGQRVQTVSHTAAAAVTLPDAPSQGSKFTIININTGAVTINVSGTDTLDDDVTTSLVLSNKHDRVTLQYAGTVWYIV